ncbi:hypothetical protein OHA77_16175 [Streptosporangium sp. NBC_01639]|uniref:hypothetical protein n=1 Tax=Streptosporangium sp. NBC_01639 TaxID=2975948 RepID=UPI00386BF2E7|nr:hypothetical protein OHA77_16175 [Streptosporangium sp. NBC_01639]
MTQHDWSSWPPYPIPPSGWPGLDDRSKDDIDADRAKLKSVAGLVARVATHIAEVGIQDPLPDGDVVGPTWQKGRQVYYIIRFFHNSIRRLRGDIAHELIAAALLVYRVGENYDLAEDPTLLKAPREIRDPANAYWEPTSISWGYPESEDSWDAPKSEEIPSVFLEYDPINEMSVQDIETELSALSNSGVGDLGAPLIRAADEFAGAVDGLFTQATELYAAPWRGSAASVAQQKLAQITVNLTALASLSGLVGQSAGHFHSIVTNRKNSLASAADEGRGWWHETFDLGGTPTSRARNHLRDAEEELDKIARMLPRSVREDLPGLIQEAARRPTFHPSPVSLKIAKETIEDLRDKIAAATSPEASEARNAQMWEESGTISKNEAYLQGLKEQLEKVQREYAEAQK